MAYIYSIYIYRYISYVPPDAYCLQLLVPVIQHLRYDPNNTNVQDAGTCLGALAVYNPRFPGECQTGNPAWPLICNPQLLWIVDVEYVLCTLVTYIYIKYIYIYIHMLQIQCLRFKPYNHARQLDEKEGTLGVWEPPLFGVVVFQNAYGCFQKIGVLQNGWFIMENSIF